MEEKHLAKLEEISDKLNEIAGRLIVTAMNGNKEVKVAHEMILQIGVEIDEILEEEN